MYQILLVDDDHLYRAALSRLLRPTYEILEAGDGLQAQKIVLHQNVDIVVSDIRMPKNDGLKLLKWLREARNIPVILISGYSEVLENIQAKDLGADGFLAKPFKFNEIKNMIDSLLAKKPDERKS